MEDKNKVLRIYLSRTHVEDVFLFLQLILKQLLPLKTRKWEKAKIKTKNESPYHYARKIYPEIIASIIFHHKIM